MKTIIENYVAWAFNENSYYGNLYQDTSLIVTHEGDDIDEAVFNKFITMYHQT